MPKSLKDKHKDRLWLDQDDDIWFCNLNTGDWGYLCIYPGNLGGGAYVSAYAAPDETYGPYRELKR